MGERRAVSVQATSYHLGEGARSVWTQVLEPESGRGRHIEPAFGSVGVSGNLQTPVTGGVCTGR